MTPKGLTRKERKALSDFDLAASLDEADRRMLMRVLGEPGLEDFQRRWEHRARPAQLPPPGDWQVWLVMAVLRPVWKPSLRQRAAAQPCHPGRRRRK